MGIDSRLIHVELINDIFQFNRRKIAECRRSAPGVGFHIDRRLRIQFAYFLRGDALHVPIIIFLPADLIRFIDQVISPKRLFSFETCHNALPYINKMIKILLFRIQPGLSELITSAGRSMKVDNQLDPVFFRPFKLFLQIIQPGIQPAVIFLQIQIGVGFPPVADKLRTSEICAIRGEVPVIRLFQVVAEHHSAENRTAADLITVFRNPVGIDFLHEFPARLADLQRIQIECHLAGAVLKTKIKDSIRCTFRNIRNKTNLFLKRSPKPARMFIYSIAFRRAV